ncbi:MAG: protein kinase [Gemmataceae bacterium]
MANTSSDREPIDCVAEEFLARYRRGERPTVAEYAARHPDLADEIRELFPALVMMEQAAPGSADPSAVAVSRNGRHAAPERLGDFRILREVGRGGMGVVYEAVQESLGRHVALKLLPPDAILDPKRLRRFQREAKAAANLHHTNIVPVYGVGEAGGTHFYAMQFIRGQGMDSVIDELRRLRAGGDVPAGGAARSLMTGEFVGGRSPLADLTGPASGTDEMTAAAPPSTAVSGSLGDTGRHYWESVAKLGAQVADALAYAHAQGIIHRDIKPSNLLLDPAGTVWVTDFGLAKVTSDADDLSHTGDILGTLRYMAPERFGGEGDARADTYALGLTLYELLTFRPAFDGDSRPNLIEAALHDEPARPRKLNPAVPRDLETVVLKATAKDPARRYQSAAELAADLRRFAEDRPVQARRATPAERAWRWCRRNPLVASLLTAVVSLLVAITAVSVLAAARDRAAQAAAQKGKKLALNAVDEMWVAVAEKWLKEAPELELVQKQFLEKALEYYQELAKDDDRDPEVRLASAGAYRKMGEIHRGFADDAKAWKAHDTSAKLLTALVAEFPNDERYQFELAVSHMAQAGEENPPPSRQPLALETAEKAMDLFRTLAEAHPDDARYREWIACAYFRRAMTGARSGRGPKNEADFRKALELFEPLTRANPGNSYLRGRYHRCQIDFSRYYFDRRRVTEAEELSRQSVSGLLRLAEEFPREHVHRAELTEALNHHAYVLDGAGRSAEAVSVLRQEVGMGEQLIATYPNAAHYRRRQLEALGMLGSALRRLDRPAEAEVEFERAIAQCERLIARFKHEADYRWTLVNLLASLGDMRLRTGRHAEAEDAYRRSVVVQQQRVTDQPGNEAMNRTLMVRYDRLAACLRRANRVDAALAALREYITFADGFAGGHHENPAVLEPMVFARRRLGEELSTLGRHDEAEQAFLDALAQCDKLMAYYARAAARAWDRPAIQRQRVRNFFRQGQSDQAVGVVLADVAQAERRLDADPKRADARAALRDAARELAVLHEWAGRLEDAASAARRELDVAAGLAADYPGLAAHQTRHDEARAHLTRLLWRAGRTAEATAEARRESAEPAAAGTDPVAKVGKARLRALVTSANTRGLLLGLVNQVAEADAAFQKALVLGRQRITDFPKDTAHRQSVATTLRNRGNLFVQAGRPDTAEAAYREALTQVDELIASFPDSLTDQAFAATMALDIARFFVARGQESEAGRCVATSRDLREKLVESRPGVALHVNNLARFLCTCPVPSLRDPARAVALAEKAVDLNPTALHTSTLGVAHYRSGNWPAAATALQQSAAQDDWPGRPDTAFFLAMAHWQLGERDGARKQLAEAVRLTEMTDSPDGELQDIRTEAGCSN